MYLLKVGFDYKSAPLEIRERYVIPEDKLDQAMKQLKQQKSILEDVIISTCNRTEVFAVADQAHTGRYYIKQFLADWFQVDLSFLSPYLQIAEGDEAVDHLFRVTTGLDSIVLGETQIIGQMKDAFLAAQKQQTTGTIFNELFKRAVTFAKKVHKNTTIGQQAVSVSYAAVELAKKIFGDLHKKHVIIHGAGEMGELAAKNMHGSGASDITVVNRTFAKAESLAQMFQGQAKPIEQLSEQMQDADILISSTASDSIVLTREFMEKVQRKRKGKPLFVVDIAVPRDMDPKIGELDDVFLYDVDDLQHIVDENLESRKTAAESVETMLGEEITAFNSWVQTLGVVPVISGLRKKALTIQAETMQSIERKMPDLTEREKKVLNKHTKSIINQLLKQPVNQAKELAEANRKDEARQQFIAIFGIEDEVNEELEKQTTKYNSITGGTNENRSSPPINSLSSS